MSDLVVECLTSANRPKQLLEAKKGTGHRLDMRNISLDKVWTIGDNAYFGARKRLRSSLFILRTEYFQIKWELAVLGNSYFSHDYMCTVT